MGQLNCDDLVFTLRSWPGEVIIEPAVHPELDVGFIVQVSRPQRMRHRPGGFGDDRCARVSGFACQGRRSASCASPGTADTPRRLRQPERPRRAVLRWSLVEGRRPGPSRGCPVGSGGAHPRIMGGWGQQPCRNRPANARISCIRNGHEKGNGGTHRRGHRKLFLPKVTVPSPGRCLGLD